MFNVVLIHPEIPPNTGNIIRLCANSGSELHIIKPTGFTLDNTRMKRAGLDYHEITNIKIHESWTSFLANENPNKRSFYALSTKGRKTILNANFKKGDWLAFGSETRGFTQETLSWVNNEKILRLPMIKGNRSLNLSNAVAITVYEAWRQHSYEGGA